MAVSPGVNFSCTVSQSSNCIFVTNSQIPLIPPFLLIPSRLRGKFYSRPNTHAYIKMTRWIMMNNKQNERTPRHSELHWLVLEPKPWKEERHLVCWRLFFWPQFYPFFKNALVFTSKPSITHKRKRNAGQENQNNPHHLVQLSKKIYRDVLRICQSVVGSCCIHDPQLLIPEKAATLTVTIDV